MDGRKRMPGIVSDLSMNCQLLAPPFNKDVQFTAKDIPQAGDRSVGAWVWCCNAAFAIDPYCPHRAGLGLAPVPMEVFSHLCKCCVRIAQKLYRQSKLRYLHLGVAGRLHTKYRICSSKDRGSSPRSTSGVRSRSSH